MTLELRRLLWLAAAAALGLAVVVGLAAVVVNYAFREVHSQILLTTWAALLCGGALLSALRLVERRLAPVFGVVLAAAAPVGFALFAIPIWFDDAQTLTWGRVVLTALFLLVSALIAATLRLLLGRASRIAFGVFLGVAVALTATNALGLYFVWTVSTDDGGSNDALVDYGGRALVALFLLAVAGYLLAPVLERAFPRTPAPPASPASERTS